MAKPTTLRWTKLSIWVGDDASPENFASKVCALTTKTFSISGQTSDSVVPDCTDPDAPAWIERVMRSLSAGFAGSGLCAEENAPFYRDWALSGVSKKCRIVLDAQSFDGYFEGDFLMTKYELTGNESDGKVNFSATFDSDGPVAWVSDSSPAN